MIDWFLRTFIFKYHYTYIDLFYHSHDIGVQEKIKWVRDDFGPSRARIFVVRYASGMHGEQYPVENFCFRYEEDLMAFKLRWTQ